MSVRELHLGDSETSELSARSIDVSGSECHVDKSSVWRNESLRCIEPPLTCRIPQNILIMMRTIENKMCNMTGRGPLEFGAFLKGKLESGILTLSDDIKFVKQIVTGASIDFKEDPPEQFNGVIHRHPNSCTSFSGTDRGSINQNYEFSLLYVNNNITTGIINLSVGGTRVQVPLKTEILYPVYNIDINEVLTKIEPRQDPADKLSIEHRMLPGFLREQGIEQFLTDDEKQEEKIGEEDIELGEEKESEFESSDYDDIYLCDTCGNFQMIDRFPAKCDSCDIILTEDDVTQVASLSDDELDQGDTRDQIRQALAESNKMSW